MTPAPELNGYPTDTAQLLKLVNEFIADSGGRSSQRWRDAENVGRRLKQGETSQSTNPRTQDD